MLFIEDGAPVIVQANQHHKTNSANQHKNAEQ